MEPQIGITCGYDSNRIDGRTQRTIYNYFGVIGELSMKVNKAKRISTCSRKLFDDLRQSRIDSYFHRSLKSKNVKNKTKHRRTNKVLRDVNATAEDCMTTHQSYVSHEVSSKDHRADVCIDGTFTPCLPVVVDNRNLRAISAHTVADVLQGRYEDKVSTCTFVDCRYPFEYEGGHIPGAMNLYTKEHITEVFIKGTDCRDQATHTAGRNIVIFYCEFSMMRGPAQ